MTRVSFIVVAMLGALVLTGCGNSGADDPSPTPPVSPTPGGGTGGESAGSELGAAPASPPPPNSVEWTTGPLTVPRDAAAPSTPQLVGIRSAAHPADGYDRIVFDFASALPGYTVSYVDEVRQDGSGDLVEMPGRRYLLVVFTPARAHTDAGEALVAPRSMTLDYPMMRGYTVVGDFEGYVSVAIGLDDVVGFQVGELPGTPGRLYLDVAA